MSEVVFPPHSKIFSSNVQLPEASSQALFADCQAHIWALQGQKIVTNFSEMPSYMCICLNNLFSLLLLLFLRTISSGGSLFL